MTAQPLHTVPTVDADVQRLLTLKDAQQTIAAEIGAIKARLAETIGAGHQVDVGDVTVTVRPPNRRFNVQRATGLLDEDTLAKCVKADPGLVKKHLTPLQLDECMDEGTGDPIVDIK